MRLLNLPLIPLYMTFILYGVRRTEGEWFMNPGISRHQFKIMKNATGLQINIFSYKLPICGHYSGIVCQTFWWYLGVNVSSLPYYKVWNLTNLITCIMQAIVNCTVIAFLDFTLHSNSFRRLIVVYLVNNFITFINIASFRKKREENVP